MRSRMFAVVCVAGLMPLFAGCAGIVTLTADNNGQTVDAVVGGQLILNLASNPTTGFDWKITAIDTAILQQEGDSIYVPNASQSGATGVGGTRTWTFGVKAAGSTTLTLEYRQAGQPDSEPAAQTFTVTVEASPAV